MRARDLLLHGGASIWTLALLSPPFLKAWRGFFVLVQPQSAATRQLLENWLKIKVKQSCAEQVKIEAFVL